MPANPQHLHQGIQDFAGNLVAAADHARRTEADALQALKLAATSPDELRAAVEAGLKSESGIRCAGPATENILADIYPASDSARHSILAIDGSQVLPSRHEEVQFGLINVASVALAPGSGEPPAIAATTDLLIGDGLEAPGGHPMSEGALALRRDAAERRALLEYAGPPGSLALTDGPLELWGPKDLADQQAFDQALAQYIAQLKDLQLRGVTPAGYVDKPGADLVIRMLELFLRSTDSQKWESSQPGPLKGASDRRLFATLLGPGSRSAAFELVSSSRSRYPGDLALHFFYLNVGDEGHPVIARVEIPRWVAKDLERVAALHASLLEQCRMLGARPYPYILHRAHEEARVSLQEKDQIRLRLLMEVRNHGLEPESVSGKSSIKAIASRRRSN